MSYRLLSALLFGCLAYLQVRSGTLAGSVTDSTGASAVDVEVTVVETQTNSSKTPGTNSAGEFNVLNLGFGNWLAQDGNEAQRSGALL